LSPLIAFFATTIFHPYTLNIHLFPSRMSTFEPEPSPHPPPILPTINSSPIPPASPRQLLLHLLVTFVLTVLLYFSNGSIWAFLWAAGLVMAGSGSWFTFRQLLEEELGRRRTEEDEGKKKD
jgi:hypothetical protein